MDDRGGKHVFVSYVREDSDRVDRVCEVLEAAGIPYWRDINRLEPGDAWKKRIRNAIKEGAALTYLARRGAGRAHAQESPVDALRAAVRHRRGLVGDRKVAQQRLHAAQHAVSGSVSARGARPIVGDRGVDRSGRVGVCGRACRSSAHGPVVARPSAGEADPTRTDHDVSDREKLYRRPRVGDLRGTVRRLPGHGVQRRMSDRCRARQRQSRTSVAAPTAACPDVGWGTSRTHWPWSRPRLPVDSRSMPARNRLSESDFNLSCAPDSRKSRHVCAPVGLSAPRAP